MIKTVPEVKTVFGKAGRAETATDPAPLEMFETVIQLKPRERMASRHDHGQAGRRARRTREGPRPRQRVRAADPQPHRHARDRHQEPGRRESQRTRPGDARPARIEDRECGQDGAGHDLGDLRPDLGGRYIDIRIDRLAAARYGLSIEDVQNTAAAVVGGMPVGEKIEGLARFPINVRFPRETRGSVEELRNLPIIAPTGGIVPLGAVASVEIADGPTMVKSENARPAAWVYVDVRDRDLIGFVKEARAKVADAVPLPPGYSLVWSGQFEYAERANKRLAVIVPLTVLGHLPPALLCLPARASAVDHPAGASLGAHRRTVAGLFPGTRDIGRDRGGLHCARRARGRIRSDHAGLSDHAIDERIRAGQFSTAADLDAALIDGAVRRVRPKAMTAAVILAGLFPLLVGGGAGHEVMQRLAAPMVGGMITAPLLSLFVLPAIYKLLGPERLGVRVQSEPQAEPTSAIKPARAEPAGRPARIPHRSGGKDYPMVRTLLLAVAASCVLVACSQTDQNNEVQAGNMSMNAMHNDMMGNGMCSGAACDNGMMDNGMMSNGMTGGTTNGSASSGMPADSNAAVNEHIVHHDNTTG